MTRFIFNILLLLYSLAMSLVVGNKFEFGFVLLLNILIFYFGSTFSYHIVKFFTEVLEHQLYCDEYFQLSPYLDTTFVVSLSMRLVLFFCHSNSILLGNHLIMIYTLTHLILFFVIFQILIQKKEISKVEWIKNIMMLLPMIVYLILDIYSFKGVLSYV